ncbi:MAG: nitrilase-related carbon-nitrogen hydrolase [Rikenellaceae bacterium]
MNISLIQTSIKWLQPEENRRCAEEWISKCQGSALTLLPEMFDSGFCMDPLKSSVECTQSLNWMVDMARKYQMAIGGSIAVEHNGDFYNRFYVVESCGKMHYANKRHLFSYAGEDDKYSAGAKRVVITLNGVRILLLVCYDLRFPVWMRNCGDYDVVACVANWPKSRRAVWDTLLRARALENLAYVCGVNIVGADPSSIYSGGTKAIDFKGNIVDSVEDNMQGVATLNVDMEALREFRAKFPALEDADDFEIK